MLQTEVDPLIVNESSLRYEEILLQTAQLDDLDPSAIQEYRNRRAKIRPNAPELKEDDLGLLKALRVVGLSNNEYIPNIAGILLFGKPEAIRRLLPSVRVDYVRLGGTIPNDFSTRSSILSRDLIEPLVTLIPHMEYIITDDLPRRFILKPSSVQREDPPILPNQVVREALVNAVMHRDYSINQPTLVIRYSNRIEVKNAGYSLKPDNSLGTLGSVLRNPILASVLYDINFAEKKGSGIHTSKEILTKQGLHEPVFQSDCLSNEFVSVYQFQDIEVVEDVAAQGNNRNLAKWQINQCEHPQEQQYGIADLTPKAHKNSLWTVILWLCAVRTCSIEDLCQTLNMSAASLEEKYLDILLTQEGLIALVSPETANNSLLTYRTTPLGIKWLESYGNGRNTSDLAANTSDLAANTSDLSANSRGIPAQLQVRIDKLTPKARKTSLWSVILWLCAVRPHSSAELSQILNRQLVPLKNSHLSIMRKQQGLIAFTHPDNPNHHHQAYRTTEAGLKWLAEHGIELDQH